MKLIKRGPFYWIDFRDSSGKRRRLTTGESEEAVAYVKAGTIVRNAAVASMPAADPRRTLSDGLETTYASHWSRTRSATSMRHTVNLLKRELAGVALTNVTTKLLRTHCDRWLTAGIAPATVNRRMSAIGVALTRGAEEGDIPARPKMPHFAENNVKERYMTAVEEHAILAELARRSAADVAGDWRHVHQLAVFLVDTGFRFSEAFKFTLQDGHANLLHGSTKSEAGRMVPLTTRARAAAEYLLASEQHRALRAMPAKRAWDHCSYRFGVATTAAGCPDVTLHILRHTTASRLVQKGVPIYTVSKWLGHSSVKITERYAKLAPNSLDGALAALEG